MSDISNNQKNTIGIENITSGNDLVVNSDGSILTDAKFANPGTQYVRIATNTTTVVKSGAGVLRRIVKSAGGTATMYDNTSAAGTIIHILTGTNPQGTIFYDVRFTTGLTIVTTSGPDLVVVYE